MKKIRLLSMLLIIFVFACSENNDVIKTSGVPAQNAERSSERIGTLFYDRINSNALEDPTVALGDKERQTLNAAFAKLKSNGPIRAKVVLDESLQNGDMSLVVHDAILSYNDAISQLVQETSEFSIIEKWSQDQEQLIKNNSDLNDTERERILTHYSLTSNYVKATIEGLPDATENANGRVESWKSILCYVSCAIDNITSFSEVGSKAGDDAEVIGAGVGLIYTIVGGATACPNCNSSVACQYATSVSSADVCYSTSSGKTFTAWGYGSTPIQFAWDFYNFDNLSTPFFTYATPGDSYTLTNAQLGGRTKIAVRVRTNCSGTDRFSQYLWFSINDAGKPRPKVSVTEMGGNLVRYTVVGTNNGSPSWGFIPAYRGSLVAGSYSSGTITIQWVSAQMRVGAFVTTTSSCGSASASAY